MSKVLANADKKELNYFYGKEADQFTFYALPKILIHDERYRSLSSDAKLLYAIMKDRMKLSMKNGWLDEKNRVYIFFTIEEVKSMMGCANNKAINILAELDTKKGVGLIAKERQGLGKPDRIYVKNFVCNDDLDKSENSANGTTDFIDEETNNQKCENENSVINSSFTEHFTDNNTDFEENITAINNTDDCDKLLFVNLIDVALVTIINSKHLHFSHISQ